MTILRRLSSAASPGARGPKWPAITRTQCWALFARLASARSGATAVFIALALTALIGVAGLATEAAGWYLTKRTMQNAADAGAFSGAVALWIGESKTLVISEAKTVTKKFGFADGTSSVTVTVNNPPASGPNSTDATAVEVIISQPQPLELAALFLSTQTTIAARSVALAKQNGFACILALDPNAAAALNVSGRLPLHPRQLPGIEQHDAGVSEAPDRWRPPLVDPYAGTTIPALGSHCDQTNLVLSDVTKSLSPGTYCGGITSKNTTTINFAPGTYYINGGNFNISSSSTLKCTCVAPGDGVTFVLTSTGAASNIGTVQISGSANLNLPAPTSGGATFPGILFFQDPRANANAASTFTSGTTVKMTGAIYFPASPLIWDGNDVTTSTTCTMIVVRTVSFINSAALNDSGCVAAGINEAVIRKVALAE